jgi:hypothetical protein
MPDAKGTRRYNLVLPESLYNEIQSVADKKGTTVVDWIKTSLKLGLLADRITSTPGAALLIREGDTLREIVLL